MSGKQTESSVNLWEERASQLEKVTEEHEKIICKKMEWSMIAQADRMARLNKNFELRRLFIGGEGVRLLVIRT